MEVLLAISLGIVSNYFIKSPTNKVVSMILQMLSGWF